MSTQSLPQFNQALCTRCGNCIEGCPTHATDMREDGPVIARPEDCTYCAECEALCPDGAITVTYQIVWATSRRQETDVN